MFDVLWHPMWTSSMTGIQCLTEKAKKWQEEHYAIFMLGQKEEDIWVMDGSVVKQILEKMKKDGLTIDEAAL